MFVYVLTLFWSLHSFVLQYHFGTYKLHIFCFVPELRGQRHVGKLSVTEMLKSFAFYRAENYYLVLQEPSSLAPLLSHIKTCQCLFSIFPKIHFATVFASTSSSYKWSLPLRCFERDFVGIPDLSYGCCIRHPWFNHPDNVWWKVYIIKLLILQFEAFCRFLLGPDIVLKNPLCKRPLSQRSFYIPTKQRVKLMVWLAYLDVYRYG